MGNKRSIILNTHVKSISMTILNIFVAVYHHFPALIEHRELETSIIKRLKDAYLLSQLRL